MPERRPDRLRQPLNTEIGGDWGVEGMQRLAESLRGAAYKDPCPGASWKRWRLPAVAAAFSFGLLLTVQAQITVNQPIPSVATVHVDAGRPAGAVIPRTIFGT